LCSSKFIRGRPSEQAQIVGHFLNSLLKSVINPEELKCKYDGEESLSWYLWLDIYCLDYDGNIFDATLISAIGALKNASLPNIKKENGLYYSTKERPNRLTLTEFPLSLTFCMMDHYILCDPTFEEENLQNGSFTIVVNQSGGLLSISKPNGFSLDGEQLKFCLQKTIDRATLLLNLFNNSEKKKIMDNLSHHKHNLT